MKPILTGFSITFAITMTSCPTLCIPCGFTEKGLPIGIQVVAPPRHEANLINFGHKLQTIFAVSDQLPISKNLLKPYIKYCVINLKLVTGRVFVSLYSG